MRRVPQQVEEEKLGNVAIAEITVFLLKAKKKVLVGKYGRVSHGLVLV